jgi:hypothetical protein
MRLYYKSTAVCYVLFVRFRYTRSHEHIFDVFKYVLLFVNRLLLESTRDQISKLDQSIVNTTII